MIRRDRVEPERRHLVDELAELGEVRLRDEVRSRGEHLRHLHERRPEADDRLHQPARAARVDLRRRAAAARPTRSTAGDPSGTRLRTARARAVRESCACVKANCLTRPRRRDHRLMATTFARERAGYRTNVYAFASNTPVLAVLPGNNSILIVDASVICTSSNPCCGPPSNGLMRWYATTPLATRDASPAAASGVDREHGRGPDRSPDGIRTLRGIVVVVHERHRPVHPYGLSCCPQACPAGTSRPRTCRAR